MLTNHWLFFRITRLMGESFALHSQALVGYVDDVSMSSADEASL